MSLFENRLDRFEKFMNEEDTDIKKITIREFSEDIDEYKEMKKQQRQEVSLDLESIIQLYAMNWEWTLI